MKQFNNAVDIPVTSWGPRSSTGSTSSLRVISLPPGHPRRNLWSPSPSPSSSNHSKAFSLSVQNNRNKRSMCNYVPVLLFPFMIKLVLIHLSIEFLFGAHVHHSVSAAFMHPPRLTGPAAFYFQIPPHRRRASSEAVDNPASSNTERINWLTKLDQGLPTTDPLPRRHQIQHQLEEQREQQEQSVKDLLGLSKPGSPKPSRPAFSPCGASVSEGDCQREGTHQDVNNDLVKKQIIERYKQVILRQMNLDQIPMHPPITENVTSWKALPAILRHRLKAEVDTSNQHMDDPVEDDEEKESFILLKHYPFQLEGVPSMAFTLKIADDIDPNHISYARIHSEHTDNVEPGTEVTLWEISPTVSQFNPTNLMYAFQNTEPSFDPQLLDQYTDPMFYSTEETPGQDLDSISEQPRRSFRLIWPKIALANVHHHNSVANSTRFDVTGKLISWLKQRKRTRASGPLLRYLLFACPKCDGVQIVDPKKVVLEIGYRQALRRIRRSLNGTDDDLTNACQSGGQQFTCCTQSLKIYFSEIGWDRWIIHPKKFEPNYCRGSCQVNGFQSTHYEVLNLLSHKNLTQLKDVPRGTIQSCCYPTRRTTFTLLYLDRNKDVRMHTLHNLIVLGCGCS
ncbi:Inhibin beta B chain [Fasciola gigantica]|uniref:Inhibin beta B chain n=1 Tax=Fasciola gigantica TaxID=46835 RepID=A0A504YUD4_FASGI|nr:Inhibin beta B chain [Fasciola gigantica]